MLEVFKTAQKIHVYDTLSGRRSRPVRSPIGEGGEGTGRGEPRGGKGTGYTRRRRAF